MGINPKIGITGLPRSGKSIVLQKVIDMIKENGGLGSRRMRGPNAPENIIGGMRTEVIIENGERMGFACVNISSTEFGVGRPETNNVVAPTAIGKVIEFPRPYAKKILAAEKTTSLALMPP